MKSVERGRTAAPPTREQSSRVPGASEASDSHEAASAAEPTARGTHWVRGTRCARGLGAPRLVGARPFGLAGCPIRVPQARGRTAAPRRAHRASPMSVRRRRSPRGSESSRVPAASDSHEAASAAEPTARGTHWVRGTRCARGLGAPRLVGARPFGLAGCPIRVPEDAPPPGSPTLPRTRRPGEFASRREAYGFAYARRSPRGGARPPATPRAAPARSAASPAKPASARSGRA